MTKTLGYGLNVGIHGAKAEFYVLIFLARRLTLAFCIVYAYETFWIGSSLLLVSVFVNLTMLVKGNLWQDSWIALQHTVNEIVVGLFVLTSLAVSQSFIIGIEMRDASGWFLVSLLMAFLVFNVAIIIYDTIRII